MLWKPAENAHSMLPMAIAQIRTKHPSAFFCCIQEEPSDGLSGYLQVHSASATFQSPFITLCSLQQDAW